ncbi:MAG: glycoside hydrolase family 3 C-terminal domain-containing protein [Firmicutes bacterium]|nr:glycoside hydrolase family 3 C-terminal domain-containing protein [Bacillota bacterium]
MDRANNQRLAAELVARMSVEEAASMLLYDSPAVERLGIPAYNWWSEGLHGVARAGTATVYPQAIGLAASFDADMVHQVADQIATEARAKYNVARAQGDTDQYKGLTFWSPNINIFRDPRWGRGQETYGEDPCLTAALGKAYITGMQGDGKYLKAAACAKHFAVHSGPEALRYRFDAVVSEKDMQETYLPAFRCAVQEAGVEAVVGAYNAVNGEPACCSERLLVRLLRHEWGFEGHVVSDCGAIKNIHEAHHYTASPAESASLAVRRGCDLNCGCTYEHLLEGLRQGLITEQEIRTSAERLLATRFALGMFDPSCEWNRVPYTAVGQRTHRDTARRAAEESIVLLKNAGILPLRRQELQTIAVIGPNAYSHVALYANYHGDSDSYITDLEGIRKAAGEGIRVLYSQGCDIFRAVDDRLCKPGRLYSEAVAAASCSDAVILCLGLDASMEGEQGDASNSSASGDKTDLLLPEPQRILAQKILALGKPVIVCIHSGSPLDLSAFEEKTAAILQCWYPGQSGGEALGRILFGEVNPSGKLPVSFYYDSQPLPDFGDYRMAGRSYKFVHAAPWYPFGFGLSYSRFRCHAAAGSGWEISATVENSGAFDGAQVLQCYTCYLGEAFEKPRCQLIAFRRVFLKAGRSCELCIPVSASALETVLGDGSRRLLDGEYLIFLGFSQPDERSVALMGQKPQAIRWRIGGGEILAAEPADYEPLAYADRACYALRDETEDTAAQ